MFVEAFFRPVYHMGFDRSDATSTSSFALLRKLATATKQRAAASQLRWKQAWVCHEVSRLMSPTLNLLSRRIASLPEQPWRERCYRSHGYDHSEVCSTASSIKSPRARNWIVLTGYYNSWQSCGGLAECVLPIPPNSATLNLSTPLRLYLGLRRGGDEIEQARS